MPRIFCIGRNYINHALELGNKVPTKPIIFMKPFSSLVKNSRKIIYPAHGQNLHYETELVLQIGKMGKPRNTTKVKQYISGFAIGLDLTLRDIQRKLKEKGHPWEISKSFDDSAAITSIVHYQPEIHDLNDLNFKCYINDIERQNDNTSNMIFSIETLLIYISSIWSFEVGDLIYTGTPEGVGEIKKGEIFRISGDFIPEQTFEII